MYLLLKNGGFPASYVSLPEGSYRSQMPLPGSLHLSWAPDRTKRVNGSSDFFLIRRCLTIDIPNHLEEVTLPKFNIAPEKWPSQ